MLPCPKCGKRAAARAHFYVCRDCGERFEALWERPADPTLEKPDPLKAPDLVYKRPDGDWVPSVQQLGPIPCPKCGRTHTTPPRPE
jgi:hypothetical protein